MPLASFILCPYVQKDNVEHGTNMEADVVTAKLDCSIILLNYYYYLTPQHEGKSTCVQLNRALTGEQSRTTEGSNCENMCPCLICKQHHPQA